MAGVVGVIWAGGEAVYFFERDWTGQITLNLLGKIEFSEKSIFARLRSRQSKQPSLGRLLRADEPQSQIGLDWKSASAKVSIAI